MSTVSTVSTRTLTLNLKNSCLRNSSPVEIMSIMSINFTISYEFFGTKNRVSGRHGRHMNFLELRIGFLADIVDIYNQFIKIRIFNYLFCIVFILVCCYLLSWHILYVR